MSAKLIFKMEFYKFFNDKKYLIIAIVLGVLNTVGTIQLLDSLHSYYGASDAAGMGAIIGLSYMSSMVFLFIYPFHALELDYKNNVMAMMMASGVNRTKLYFSKMGSAILCSMLLILIVVFIPMILVGLKYGSIGFIGEIFNGVFSELAYMGTNPILYLLSLILGYIYIIIAVNFAIIQTRGSGKSVLLFFGVQFVILMIRMVLSPISNIYEYNVNGTLVYGIILNLIFIAGLALLSLRQLKNQNL